MSEDADRADDHVERTVIGGPSSGAVAVTPHHGGVPRFTCHHRAGNHCPANYGAADNTST